MNIQKTLYHFFKRLRIHRFIKTYGTQPNHWDPEKLPYLEAGLKDAKTHPATLKLLKTEKALEEKLEQLEAVLPAAEPPKDLNAKLIADAAPFLKKHRNSNASHSLWHEIFLKDLKISLASLAVAVLFSLSFIYGRTTLSASSQLISNETTLFEDVTFFLNSGDFEIEQELISFTIEP